MGDVPSIAIAIVGASGSGKSTFSNLVSGDHLGVSDSLRSCTNKVQLCRPFMLPGYTKPVILIDTPGFDDTTISDTDVLTMIASWLSASYEEGFKLSGVIYMHRITDRRVGGVTRKNFRKLRELCGEKTLESVAIVTNMWDQEVSEEKAIAREEELKTDSLFFKNAIEKGAQMLRHNNTLESARAIIAHFMTKSPVTLQIQAELVDEKKEIDQTIAGMELQAELAVLMQQHERELLSLRQEIVNALEERDLQTKQELERERAEMKRQLLKVEADRERLSRDYREEKSRADAEIRRLKAELEARREKERDSKNLRPGAKDKGWRKGWRKVVHLVLP